jgi:hypothetical protein
MRTAEPGDFDRRGERLREGPGVRGDAVRGAER